MSVVCGGVAAALRVADVDFLRRRVELHRNAVTVGGNTYVGTLKSNKNRTVVVPSFVMDALAQTAEGKARDDRAARKHLRIGCEENRRHGAASG